MHHDDDSDTSKLDIEKASHQNGFCSDAVSCLFVWRQRRICDIWRVVHLWNKDCLRTLFTCNYYLYAIECVRCNGSGRRKLGRTLRKWSNSNCVHFFGLDPFCLKSMVISICSAVGLPCRVYKILSGWPCNPLTWAESLIYLLLSLPLLSTTITTIYN